MAYGEYTSVRQTAACTQHIQLPQFTAVVLALLSMHIERESMTAH